MLNGLFAYLLLLETMMAKVILTVKFVFIWLWNLAFAWVPTVLVQIGLSSDQMGPIIYFLIVMIFLPELGLIFSKDFRAWIRTGIEDGDGTLNKSDMKDLVALYMGLICTRIFIGFSWSQVFYQPIEMSTYMIPLAGALGGGATPVLRAYLNKKKK